MNYKSILRASLCAALIIGFSSYLSQKSDPFLAGMLIAIPVALPSLLFIDLDTEDKSKKYITGFFVSISVYFLVVSFFYYNNVMHGYDKKRMIYTSLGLWFIILSLIYLFIVASPNK